MLGTPLIEVMLDSTIRFNAEIEAWLASDKPTPEDRAEMGDWRPHGPTSFYAHEVTKLDEVVGA
jgi:hypothetical protein